MNKNYIIRKKFFLLLFSLFIMQACFAQQRFARWTDNELILDNGVVQRIIQLPATGGKFITTSYHPIHTDFKYFTKTSPDFQFEINGIVYSGNGNWLLKNIAKYTDTKQGYGAAVTLLNADQKIELTIQFLLYPNLPVIRKDLVIKNLSEPTLMLESVDVEKFETPPYWASTFSWICHDYGRRRSIGPYDGNMQDALVTIHNSDWQQGIVIGNEATGVLKHTSAFWQEPTICAGLTHKDARFPFRKYIAKGESFTTPQVFTMVYANHKDPNEILNTAVPDFVRKCMGIRLSALEHKPTFIYNTWEPFNKKINEKLIMELAKAAAASGMKEFVIDDGWQDSYGDWGIDKAKFPNGLKPVFDYIKSLGMKPGLWVSVGSAASSSKVFSEHQEWFVRDKQGRLANVYSDNGNDTLIRSACYSSGWYNYIKNVLLKLTLDYGLEYLKLDFAVVTSPYVFDNERSGCYATNHPGHKDRNESLFVNYEQMWKLFDELHAAKSNLFIDCTFEATGGLQLIDYAMLKHAEGNWLSNFNEPDSKGDLRIRNMAWWRSPAIPATALVIGNPEMQDSAWAMHVKSLAGALPIMLGDPRKLSVTDLKKYRGYADWLQLMERRHAIMSFRQDLAGYGEPMQGMWDGFQRINTDTKSGGIVGVFKQGGADTQRKVIISYLDPLKSYTVKEAVSGKTITQKATGKQLAQEGFTVTINEEYGGQLFEVAAN